MTTCLAANLCKYHPKVSQKANSSYCHFWKMELCKNNFCWYYQTIANIHRF